MGNIEVLMILRMKVWRLLGGKMEEEEYFQLRARCNNAEKIWFDDFESFKRHLDGEVFSDRLSSQEKDRVLEHELAHGNKAKKLGYDPKYVLTYVLNEKENIRLLIMAECYQVGEVGIQDLIEITSALDNLSHGDARTVKTLQRYLNQGFTKIYCELKYGITTQSTPT